MNTPLIIITQTYCNEHKLMQMVCHGFFESSVQDYLAKAENISDFSLFNQMQAAGKIIQLNFDSKKDMRDTMAGIMQVYTEPTLLFLGNINNYSLPLQEGLLKILEEPPRNLQIVMFAHASSSILGTIKSRSSCLTLSQALIIKLLDEDLQAKITKKLPKPSDFTKSLLTGKLHTDDFSAIDFTKLERNEIDLWLWQVGFNVIHLYSQNPKKNTAEYIKKVLNAQHFNEANTQKKFVFYSLLG